MTVLVSQTDQGMQQSPITEIGIAGLDRFQHPLAVTEGTLTGAANAAAAIAKFVSRAIPQVLVRNRDAVPDLSKNVRV